MCQFPLSEIHNPITCTYIDSAWHPTPSSTSVSKHRIFFWRSCSVDHMNTVVFLLHTSNKRWSSVNQLVNGAAHATPQSYHQVNGTLNDMHNWKCKPASCCLTNPWFASALWDWQGLSAIQALISQPVSFCSSLRQSLVFFSHHTSACDWHFFLPVHSLLRAWLCACRTRATFYPQYPGCQSKHFSFFSLGGRGG